MRLLTNVAVGFVALAQAGICIAEMFFWKCASVHGRLQDVFHFTPAEVANVEPIVRNAGLYNGFIAAGLVWSLLSKSDSRSLKFFFLSCVATAGIYGAATLKPATLGLQTLPALVALCLVWMSSKAA
jgi:putative membrane protein